jgi:PAS domain S-box-containing protein
MHWHFTPYVLPVTASVVICIWLALIGWRRRPAPGATAFCLLMLAVAEWALGYALELVSSGLPTALFWDNIEWLGSVSAPTLWLVFALHYTGRARWLSRPLVTFLFVEPLVTLLLVWTNPFHHLIEYNIGLDPKAPFSALIVDYGVWYWANIAYSYLVLVIGTFLICSLIQTLFRSARLYCWQAGALLIAVLAPWAGNIVFTFGLSPLPHHLDLTPFTFTITGIAFGWSLWRYRLLDIVPVARDFVIESMGDAVIVVDEQRRIVDLNPAAQRLAGHTASQAVGQPFTQVFSAWPELVEHYRKATHTYAEVVLGEGETRRCFDLRISPLYRRNGHLTVSGHLVVLNDITEHKQTERALRESEERFYNVFEEAPIGMAVVSLEGTVLQVNKAFCEMLGYSEQELAGNRFSSITHPDDIEKGGLLAMQALKGEVSSFKVEKRYLKKNHETLWADLTVTVLRNHDGQAMYGLVMLENIIERKRAKLLEEERHHIAYDLHDGLAQVAASTHQHLQAFASHYHPRSPQARQELGQALELAQLSVKEARRLIAGLRPTALDDFGLATALRLQAEAQRNDGWTIIYDEKLGSERLPPTIETTLFWVAQEALTNVRKHAGTTTARLALERQGPAIRLEVEDGGCGFEPRAVLRKPSLGEHIGLREMHERVELVGGHLTVSSQPGAGTLVVAEVQLLPCNERSMFREQ